CARWPYYLWYYAMDYW
nr:immunoglobulin heavy chain junction region [Mus musculus]